VAPNVGPEVKISEVMKYEDENSYGRLETKPDESLERRRRRKISIDSPPPKSMGRRKRSKLPDEAQLWIRRPALEKKSGLVLST